jgi:hypothetical protein
VPGFVYNDEVYGGQIQIWKKGEKGPKAWSKISDEGAQNLLQ